MPGALRVTETEEERGRDGESKRELQKQTKHTRHQKGRGNQRRTQEIWRKKLPTMANSCYNLFVKAVNHN